ncbi:MAG: ADP-ribosylglycohydrolase family protein [Candidatus Nealsonbacteria bacterium]|nr:ADP-ribosylglycohydrolase family protein [Candidatus Nealsonbacteria bacterium]
MSAHTQLPADHDQRLRRARLCLDGLSIGDGFGQCFFYQSMADMVLASREIPEPPWQYTDDTVMAMSIYEVLERFGGIDQDDLARRFTRRHAEEPGRGYGANAMEQLEEMEGGVPWREVASKPFNGEGSMGNGSAMRVGPVGAYFADDTDAVVQHAAASAEVTHAHPDAKAVAIAIALAAAYAWQTRTAAAETPSKGMIDFVLRQTPDGLTAQGLRQATRIPAATTPRDAARILGNGSHVICSDTVPFCVWNAARCLGSFKEAMWSTMLVYGDMDTTCAIVGGIVALAVGEEGIPGDWLAAREPLDIR